MLKDLTRPPFALILPHRGHTTRGRTYRPETHVRSWITAFAFSLLPLAAQAQDTGLKALETSHAGRAWMAVGRLDIDGTGFCTGSLISTTLVLTAAHCLFDKTTKQPIDPGRIEFLAGWRLGHALAYRAAQRTVVHPDYHYEDGVSATRVRHDIALIELRQPIRHTSVIPFETGHRPANGEEVGVVSYAHDRAEAPSLQEVCSVMARQSGILVMSCDVDFGASGAPIFSFEGDRPRIVSVVAAKAEMNGQRVALGTALEQSLTLLQDELSKGRGLRASPGSGAKNPGARFLKP